LHALRQCPEFGAGEARYVDTDDRAVLAVVYDSPDGAMLALTNLAARSCRISLGPLPEQGSGFREVFADAAYDPPSEKLEELELQPYGYRWIRLRHALAT
jgi:hypothetical protein